MAFSVGTNRHPRTSRQHFCRKRTNFSGRDSPSWDLILIKKAWRKLCACFRFDILGYGVAQQPAYPPCLYRTFLVTFIKGFDKTCFQSFGVFRKINEMGRDGHVFPTGTGSRRPGSKHIRCLRCHLQEIPSSFSFRLRSHGSPGNAVKGEI